LRRFPTLLTGGTVFLWIYFSEHLSLSLSLSLQIAFGCAPVRRHPWGCPRHAETALALFMLADGLPPLKTLQAMQQRSRHRGTSGTFLRPRGLVFVSLRSDCPLRPTPLQDLGALLCRHDRADELRSREPHGAQPAGWLWEAEPQIWPRVGVPPHLSWLAQARNVAAGFRAGSPTSQLRWRSLALHRSAN